MWSVEVTHQCVTLNTPCVRLHFAFVQHKLCCLQWAVSEWQACLHQSGKYPVELKWSWIKAMCCVRQEQILISRTSSEALEHVWSFLQQFALLMTQCEWVGTEKKHITLHSKLDYELSDEANICLLFRFAFYKFVFHAQTKAWKNRMFYRETQQMQEPPLVTRSARYTDCSHVRMYSVGGLRI